MRFSLFTYLIIIILGIAYFTGFQNNIYTVYSENIKTDKSKIIKNTHKTKKIIELKTEDPKDINIAFLGDVMIGGRVRDAIDEKGQSYVFSGTSEFLSKKDMLVMNLETTVTDYNKRVKKTYTFKADSEDLKGLKTFNKNIYVNLANNHMGDFGEQGMIDTVKNLKDNDIKYFGLGNNLLEANGIKIVNVKGNKIGLIGQNCVSPTTFKAGVNKIGTAFFDKEQLKQQIEYAKYSKVDLIVLNAHCGVEYSNGPNEEQKDYYHYAIDIGVDLVIGHHPHWYQGVEKYKSKIIFYSLGDYIFDIFRSRRTEEGLIVDVFIKNKKIDKINIDAVHIYDYGETKMANENQKQIILDELQSLSNKLSDIKTIKDGYIKY